MARWAVPLLALGAALFVLGVVELTHGDGEASGVLAAVLRFARYLGTLAAAGAVAFLVIVRPASMPLDRGGARLGWGALGLAAAATLVAVPAQAAYLAGAVTAAVDADALTAVAGSGFGSSVAVGLAGLGLLALALRHAGTPIAAGAGAAGALLALGAFLLTGHTVTAEPRGLASAANLLHTAAGAVWLGGLLLLPLAVRGRRRADDPAGAALLVGRFSTAAAAALAAAAGAGAALAWVEVRTVEALATPYGAVLALKVALVAGVVALGAYNNRRLVPAIRAGRDAPWGRLNKVVRLEAAGLVAVLAVTAVLVNVVPARIEAGIGAQETRITDFGPEHTATVVVEPARPGANEVHVYIDHDQGRLGEHASDVTVGFVPPDGEDTAATVEPAQVGPGHWLHLGAEMASAGEWRIVIEGAVAGDPQTAEVAVPVVDPADLVR